MLRSLLGFVVVVFAGCAHQTVNATEASGGKIQKFKIGSLDAISLEDGAIDVDNDGQTFGIGRPTSEVGDLLAAAGEKRERTTISIQALLVKDGAQVLLFDSGVSKVDWARGGELPKSLALAGVALSEVTDVFISHHHLDHAGGLVTDDHMLRFPNAAIHLSTPEWAAMQQDPETTAIAKVIVAKVMTFEPGAQLLPEVTAVATPGHTPGHSSYEISSGGEKLFYLGDLAHHVIVSVQRPDWTVSWDTDAAAGKATRQRVLGSLAKDNERVFAGHFPFPGIGHVRPQGASFVWVPESL